MISGGALSFSFKLLKLCVVLALFPVESKIAPDLGLKVKVSDPSASPSSLIPKLYVLPTCPTLSGYAFNSLALPPFRVNSKSLGSILPVAFDLANTGSLKVTAITLLSGARALAEYCGTNLSFKFALFLDWVVEVILPGLSNTDLLTGVTVKTSFPLGFPVNRTPSDSVFVPLPLTELGYFLAKVAFPPVKEYTKSAESKAPLPSSLLNTGSLKNT